VLQQAQALSLVALLAGLTLLAVTTTRAPKIARASHLGA
jgi:hypothetical protein